MRIRKYLFCGLLALVVPGLVGCIHAKRNAAEFPLEHSIVVPATFDATWQAVKRVLREQDVDIYTRDTRGSFQAFTQMKRRFYQPTRVKYDIELAEVSSEETKVYIAVVRQSYGVTLLTYPGWHDRRTTDDTGALAILAAIETRLSGETAAPSSGTEDGI